MNKSLAVANPRIDMAHHEMHLVGQAIVCFHKNVRHKIHLQYEYVPLYNSFRFLYLHFRSNLNLRDPQQNPLGDNTVQCWVQFHAHVYLGNALYFLQSADVLRLLPPLNPYLS